MNPLLLLLFELFLFYFLQQTNYISCDLHNLQNYLHTMQLTNCTRCVTSITFSEMNIIKVLLLNILNILVSRTAQFYSTVQSFMCAS